MCTFREYLVDIHKCFSCLEEFSSCGHQHGTPNTILSGIQIIEKGQRSLQVADEQKVTMTPSPVVLKSINSYFYPTYKHI